MSRTAGDRPELRPAGRRERGILNYPTDENRHVIETPSWTVEIPTLVGGGVGVTVLLLALVERLRRTFATRQDLNGFGDRLMALQSLYLQVREAADEARARTAATEAEQRHQWERIAEQVIRPLERITDKLEGVAEIQAAQASALEHIGYRLDRADGQGAPRTIQPRNRP